MKEGLKEREWTGMEIAIVGMAGRFSGASNVEEFWRNLREGVETIRDYTEEELCASGVSPEMCSDPAYVRRSGPLENPGRFDAGFFGYTPREALGLNPQHRLFLEEAWKAIEDAGYDPTAFSQPVGVFAGSSSNGYGAAVLRDPELAASLGEYISFLGNEKDFLATRVSYKLNLQGPSLTLQTACSTSLVAVHVACQSLLTGECDLALAGGSTVPFPHHKGYLYQEGSIGAPDGRCRPFDAKAKGTVGGSGVGVVVLKRLEDALNDGDSIHAVIKGSAINNDGVEKVGYTAPRIDGQARVIRAAQLAAKVHPDTLSYIEAHGTGTELGDPIEIKALTKAFQVKTENTRFCAIGSVKSNMGHLDATAGVTGLIKTVLALKHKEIPPSLHFEEPNPQIDFSASPFFVNTELKPWISEDRPRRAGVSSFGIGGTNAHVILEEAVEAPGGERDESPQVLVVSARSEKALTRMIERLSRHVESGGAAHLADMAYTLQVGRKAFEHRAALVAGPGIAQGDRVEKGWANAKTKPKVCFLFSGQGSQYVGMGRELYRHVPVFREEVDACCRVLKPLLGRDLKEVLFGEESAPEALEQTGIAQPALFVMEYALARYWESIGVKPEVMIGHSIGEYVAACLAGVMERDDALSLVAARGRLMQQMPSGSMLAVPLAEAEVAEFLSAEISLAAVNGSSLSVLSGETAAIEKIEDALAKRGVEARRLHTSHAFHSHMMEPALEAFLKEVSRVSLRAPRIPYLSNLSGTWITGEQATDPVYWAKHLRQTVRFAQGVEALLSDGEVPLFVEVGPGEALASLVRQQLEPGQRGRVIHSMRHPKEEADDCEFLLRAVGKVWCHGGPVEWKTLHQGRRRRRVHLPSYPFEGDTYWVDAGAERKPEAKRVSGDPADWFYEPSWRRVPRALDVRKEEEEGRGWLVFADRRIGEALKGRLTEAVSVVPGECFAERGGNRFEVNPKSAEDYQRLVARLKELGRSPERILHLWCVDLEENPGLEQAQDMGFFSLLYLAQALGDPEPAGPVRLVVATRGLYEVVGGERLMPEQATVCGPCKTISQEFPHIRSRQVDLDLAGQDLESAAEGLLAELGQEDAVVALRGRHRWVRDFEPVKLRGGVEPPLRSEGVYFITGGFGGMGLELAKSLARDYRAKLILMGRSGPDEKAKETLREIEALGGEVLTMNGDVSKADDVLKIHAEAKARFGTVHGVIHTAGVVGGGLISRQTREAVDNTFAPKVQGTKNLECFLEDGLDFMVLCSSQRSIMGGVGQTDYAAANAYLDAFAAKHSVEGKTAVCAMIWDGWKEVGMAVDGKNAQTFESRFGSGGEVLGLTNSQGVEAFRRMLAQCSANMVICLEDLRERMAAVDAATVERMTERAGSEKRLGLKPRPELGAAYEEPKSEAEKILTGLWEQSLGVEGIGIRDNFFELGGDSVISIQIVSKARKAGLRLSTKDVFKFQTVADLAGRAKLEAPEGRATGKDVEVTGRLPLSPVQRWFFDQNLEYSDQWNLAQLFEISGEVDVEALQKAMREVWRHHDQLRAKFVWTDGEWRAEVLPASGEGPGVEVIDLTGVPDSGLDAEVAARCDAAQRTLSLAEGRVTDLLLLRTREGKADLLLFTVHHLVMDATSLSVLLEDFVSAYEQLHADPGKAVELPVKTVSFKSWCEAWRQATEQGGFDGELEYWSSESRRKMVALPKDVDVPECENLESTQRSVGREWDEKATAKLLRELPRTLGLRANEALLAGLLEAFSQWTGSPDLMVDLEGLGREPVFCDLDVTRTVGWFTNLHPVLLSKSGGESGAELARSVREQLDAVPQRGFGYGGLNCFGRDPSIHARLAEVPKAEVSFLYLGQTGGGTDETGARAGWLRPAAGRIDAIHHPAQQRSHLISVACRIADGRLRTQWFYSEAIHRRETIERLADAYEGFLARLTGGETVAPRVSAGVERIETYPLTPLQQGMLIHNMLDDSGPVFWMQYRWRLSGALEPEIWKQAWECAVNRHTALRSSFAWENLDEPEQTVWSRVELPWREEDWRGQEDAGERFAAVMEEDRNRGVDLTRPPLMRFFLFRQSEESYLFAWSFHHIVLDGWSFRQVVSETLEIYTKLARGEAPELLRGAEFGDFVRWVTGQPVQASRTFWRERLSGVTQPTPLPEDSGKTTTGAASGNVVSRQIQLSREETSELAEFARKNRLTANTLVQAAWALLLSAYSGERDVVFGGVVSGRSAEVDRIESMVGLLINTLPVRIGVDGEREVLSWLREIHGREIETLEFEHTPLTDIQAWSELEGGLQLFESLVVFEKFPAGESNANAPSGVRLATLGTVETTNYPLVLETIWGDALLLMAIFDRERYGSGKIDELLGRLSRILLGLVRGAGQRVKDIATLSQEERDVILRDRNRTSHPYPREARVHELFEKQAAERPEAVALSYLDREMNYGELNRRGNQVARYLQRLGVRRGDRVGFCTDRSLEMMVGILGILKAGAAYMPMDPEYPDERLHYMAEDGGVPILLTQEDLKERFTGTAPKLVCLESEWEVIGQEADGNLNEPGHSGEIVYVIYTSGSTGKPKGVEIPHRAVARLLFGVDYVPMHAGQSYLHLSSITFDASTFEVWAPLLHGGRCVLYPERVPTLQGIGAALAKYEVRVLWLTAGLFNLIIDEAPEILKGVEWVMAGGEALSLRHIKKALQELPNTEIVNGYGPTECTTFALTYRLPRELPEYHRSVPIGHPIGNTTAYVLNRDLQPVPDGAEGELYLGGDGLARGYLNGPELTAERFVRDPFSDDPTARLYRTGDRVKYLADGSIEYLGRMDFQVKVRGFRIELGEIESRLSEMAEVKDVLALVLGDTPANRQLVTYVVFEDGAGEPSTGEMREFLRERLPAFMVPSAFVKLKAFPLTRNGKVDRSALPEPDFVDTRKERAFVEPRSLAERKLAGFWRELLGVEKIGVYDNYFDRGGNSILAMRLNFMIHERMGEELPLSALFEEPTIEAIARRLKGGAVSGIEVCDRAVPLPLSFAQQRLWFLSRVQAEGANYNIPLSLRMEGPLDAEALEKSLNEIVRRHESLRTSFIQVEGEPAQRIHPHETFVLEVSDYSALPETEREERGMQVLKGEAGNVFALDQGPPLAMRLLRFGAEDHVLSLVMHHIIFDGWSVDVLCRELEACYEAYTSGKTPKLAQSRVQYADFAVWQREWLRGEVLEREFGYWKEHLAGATPLLRLPADRERPDKPGMKAAAEYFEVPKEVSEKLSRVGRETGATPFLVLMAAFKVFLYRLTGVEDAVVGTPIAGRTRAEVKDLIGFFVNMLALRNRITTGVTFEDVIGAVREAVTGAFEHQELPFEKLVEELEPNRQAKYHPVFQVVFSVMNEGLGEINAGGLKWRTGGVPSETAKFDLNVTLLEGDSGVRGAFEYAADLFDAERVRGWIACFQKVLAELAEVPGQALKELPVFREEAFGTLIEQEAKEAEAAPRADSEEPRVMVAPRNETEKRLAAIWRELLGDKVFSVYDNFFDFGGHSILAIRLNFLMHKTFGTDVPLPVIFESPTIAELGMYIRANGKAAPEEKTGTNGNALSVPMATKRPEGGLPLSFAQQRLWFLAQFEKNQANYNVPLCIGLEGDLNLDALSKSLNEIVRRHEALRTVFAWEGGRPAQRVKDYESFVLPLVDLSRMEGEEIEVHFREAMQGVAQEGWDLEKGPLFRFRLYRVGAREHWLSMLFHHINFDGWSVEVLMRELKAYYEAFAGARDAEAPRLECQYPDFAVWQRDWLEGKALEGEVQFWKNRLAGAAPLLELPTDYLRPVERNLKGGLERISVPVEVTEKLRQIGRGCKTTMYMTVLAVYKILLWRLSGQKDVVVGSAIAGRTRPEVENLIGFFVNTLVLRTDLQGDPTFLECLERVRKVTTEAYSHQELPFEKLVEELDPDRSTSYHPLFQAAFSLQSGGAGDAEMGGLKVRTYDVHPGSAKFDLDLGLLDGENGLEGRIEYAQDLFKPGTIRRWADYLSYLFEQVARNPEIRLSELALMREEERTRMLADWMPESEFYHPCPLLHGLFEEQADRTPEAVAVEFGEAKLTYRELDERANQVAHYLRAGGVGPEVLVGISVERSLEMMIGVLGILKAGGAYVPMDPGYPRERIAFIAQDSKIHILLTQEALVERLPEMDVRVLRLDADWERIALEPTGRPSSGVTPDHLAYVIYTSGSTGKPKGAMNSHIGPCNRLLWASMAYGMTEEHHVAQKASMSFDISVWEMFGPLCCGSRLVLAEPGGDKDNQYLIEWIRKKKVTSIHFVPAMFRLFLDEPGVERCESLRFLFCGGDVLPMATLRLFEEKFGGRGVTLMNQYGPTEAAVDVSCWRNEEQRLPDEVSSVPIGKGISNARLYVLDEEMKPVPQGVVGELYIGGLPVCRGYWNRPCQTAQAFVPDPFSKEPGGRLYRTGDGVRYLDNGELEFVRRLDFQVKVRGFRIELGEVETALSEHPAVEECVAVVRNEAGEQVLVAYVRTTEEISSKDLRMFLAKRLPEFMVPTFIVAMEMFPLNPSGKIDRKALPAPERKGGSESEFAEPRNEIEVKIAGIWKEVLQVGRVGRTDNFFDLGGHSLLVIHAQRKLGEAIGRKVSVLDMFTYPTIELLADFLFEEKADVESGAVADKGRKGEIKAGRNRMRERLGRVRQGSGAPGKSRR